jgi:hypothetical protein
MKTILTVVSMLGEGVETNSATRLFGDAPVLASTLRGITDAALAGNTVILCWSEQTRAIEPFSRNLGAEILAIGPFVELPNLQAIAAARRWSDGWRCGPLGVSAFDSGFLGPAIRDAADHFAADAVLLVDPAAALVDPQLISGVAARWQGNPELDFTFTPAATGLGALLLARPLLDRLVAANAHPGKLLAYFPDQVSREPTSGDGCVPVATPAARSVHRFTLGSQRQMEKLATADRRRSRTACDSAESVASLLNNANPLDRLPRDVTLELTTRRNSKPIFSPLAAGPIDRADLPFEEAIQLIDELAELDEARLTLAGVGDPLLHPRVIDIISHAASCGVAVNVESDLLASDPALIAALASSPADVISVHLPALADATYQRIMGVDGYRQAISNIQLLVATRAATGRGTPLVIPLFTKCRENLAEMEPWYDQWLRAVGSAAIIGPTTFGGLIPDVSAADMTPPRRVPCRRLRDRLTVLSDGSYVTCEQDVLGQQSLGRVGIDPLQNVWRAKCDAVRNCHRDGRWNELPLCARCKEWHRP